MSDDLATLTNAELAERLREGELVLLGSCIVGRSTKEIASFLDEAAARLATPPGDAVEVVARALCAAEGRDPDGETWHWNGDHQEPCSPAWAHFIGPARVALAALSARAHGEQMREAAAFKVPPGGFVTITTHAWLSGTWVPVDTSIYSPKAVANEAGWFIPQENGEMAPFPPAEERERDA